MQAFKRHKQVSPFHLPGECDLTADVDFALLAEAFSQHGL
jgi:NADH dehydrogenase [ubiquinone] 1 alpha subcomplex assembly factor 7